MRRCSAARWICPGGPRASTSPSEAVGAVDAAASVEWPRACDRPAAMKLIGSNTSPYVRKVRIVMAEKKLDYQYVVEDVWANDNMLKSNPLGKVPCLVVEGVEAIFDSRVIDR